MVHKIYEELYIQLTLSLSGLFTLELTPPKLLSESIKIIRNFMDQLRQLMFDHPLAEEEDEIYFFKRLKPKFYAEKILCLEIYSIEMSRPVGTTETIKSFLEDELRVIQRFFQQNAFMYQYYRTGAVELDSLYFIRGAEIPSIMIPEIPELDPTFSTGMDYLFAKFIAYERLVDHLLNLIKVEENRLLVDPFNESRVINGTTETLKRQTWTDSKVDLIELAYALHARGSIGYGKTEVKQVVKTLERAFNIDLGNYYGVFNQNIRIRKKNRTPFLDQLKEYLERRMDDLDE